MNSIARLKKTDLADRIAVMRYQEEHVYKGEDYLMSLALKNIQNCSTKVVDEFCRLRMAQWCFDVADYYKFDHETVCISISYLDRYLSTDIGVAALLDRRHFQLIAMSTLYIAIKLNEPMEMGIDLLSEISRGIYSKERIAQAEIELLSALEWKMHPPTAFNFVHYLLSLLPPSTIHNSTRKFLVHNSCRQTAIASMDYSFVTYNSSTIAVASILNSLDKTDHAHFSLASRQVLFDHILTFALIDVRAEVIEHARARLNYLMAQEPTHKMKYRESQNSTSW